MRVVSLLPSATDIIRSLGAGAELVGVSHSCGPQWRHLPQLTSTWIDTGATSQAIDHAVKTASQPLYRLDVDLLERLAPDVVVSQSLCDVCAVAAGDVVEAVQAITSRPRLVDLTPYRLHDVPADFAQVGRALERERQADRLIEHWHSTFERYRDQIAHRQLRVAFLDWLDPPFAAGHWIPDMIEWLGGRSVLGRPGEPSHELTWQRVRSAGADVIIAAVCGFSATRALQDAVPEDLEIVLLDGYELFSRPGPGLLESLVLLAEVLTTSAQPGNAVP